jgi:hypothetical protein
MARPHKLPRQKVGQYPFTAPVLQYDHKGKFIKEWKSVTAAKDALNTYAWLITHVCIGKRQTTAGYQWRYKKGNELPVTNLRVPNRNDPYNYFKTASEYSEGVTRAQFSGSIKRFSELVMDEILLKSKSVKLPGLGEFFVMKEFPFNKKTGRMYYGTDVVSSIRERKKIYHLNEFRDGFRYRFTWKRSSLLTNSYIYIFKRSPETKRRLSYILLNDLEIDYQERIKHRR